MSKPNLECPNCGWPREWDLDECDVCGWRVSSEPSARNKEPIDFVPVHGVHRQQQVQTVQHTGPRSHTIPEYHTAPIYVAQQSLRLNRSSSSRQQQSRFLVPRFSSLVLPSTVWVDSAAQRGKVVTRSRVRARSHRPLTASALSPSIEGDGTEAEKPLDMMTLHPILQENTTPSVDPASNNHAESWTSFSEPHSSTSNSTDLSDDTVELISATEYSPSLDDDVYNQIEEHQLEAIRKRACYLRDSVMYGMQITLDGNSGTINCTSRGSSSRSSAVRESSLNASSGSNSGSRPNAKRRRNKGDDEPPKDHRDNCQNRNAKRNKKVGDDTPSIACPFYKRDPRRCHHRACTQSGFSTIPRLKEHLRRDHRMYQCLRCWAPFATLEDLEAHLANPTGCSVREVRYLFAINQNKWELIGSRVKAGTKEEQWRRMFTTIFPYVTESCIPSPYYEVLDQDVLDNFYDDFESDDNRQPLIEFKAFLGSHLARKFEEKLMKTSNVHMERSGDMMNPPLLPEHLKGIVQEALTELECEFERPKQGPSNTDYSANTAYAASISSTSQYTRGFPSQDGSIVPDWNTTLNLEDFNYDNLLLDYGPEPQQDSNSHGSLLLAPMNVSMSIPPIIHGHQLSGKIESLNEESLYQSAMPNRERGAIIDQPHEASSQNGTQLDKHQNRSTAAYEENMRNQWELLPEDYDEALFGPSFSNFMSWSEGSEGFL